MCIAYHNSTNAFSKPLWCHFVQFLLLYYGYIIVLCVYRDIGQQCCYDAKGRYTTDNPSAGSADYRYPYHHYLLHQSSDYFPYKACCIDSNDTAFCSMYYELRPKGNGICQTNKPKIGKLCTY